VADFASGRCLCGTVAYRAAARGIMGYCHCSICRKWSGALFTTNLNTPRDGFAYERGRDRIAFGTHRGFCSVCGSVVPGPPHGPPWLGVPAGQLGSDPGLRPAGHVFWDSRVPWLERSDELPTFARWPPGMEPDWAKDPDVELPGPPTDFAPAKGPARGSCLCGTVRYRVDASAARFHRCYCSRCRRLTGSAYACNLIVAPAAFALAAGREAIRRYDLPEARSFANEFCTRCGCPVPHPTRSGREVVVPAGTLDDDPGIRASADVHVEDARPWL
jgi:hypothetical protein